MQRLTTVDLIFDGPPGPTKPALIEAVGTDGRGVELGKWRDLGDGKWALRFTAAEIYPQSEDEALRDLIYSALEILGKGSIENALRDVLEARERAFSRPKLEPTVLG